MKKIGVRGSTLTNKIYSIYRVTEEESEYKIIAYSNGKFICGANNIDDIDDKIQEIEKRNIKD